MKKVKFVILLALLAKVSDQIQSILKDCNQTRIEHWQSQISTIYEDVQDKMNEIENEA